MANVSSSAITSVNYDPDSGTMSVNFTDGSTYIYDDVPESVYQDFVGSGAVGAYFNYNIRGEYSYRAV